MRDKSARYARRIAKSGSPCTVTWPQIGLDPANSRDAETLATHIKIIQKRIAFGPDAGTFTTTGIMGRTDRDLQGATITVRDTTYVVVSAAAVVDESGILIQRVVLS